MRDITSKHASNLNQRLEEIEDEAQALKQSLMDTSKQISYRQYDEDVRGELKHCKKTLQKTQAKYQQLIKEHSTLCHEYQVRDLQMQR